MSRRGILLVASVLVAGIGTALIALYVHGADARARSRYEQVYVYVTNSDRAAGTSLADLATCQCLHQALVSREAAATAVDPFQARTPAMHAAARIPAGTILQRALFTDQSPATGGTHALPVTVDEAPAGLRKDDRVDIWAQARGTATLVAHDLVLARDARSAGTGQAQLVLVVTEDQAQTILAASGPQELTASPVLTWPK